MAENIAKDFLDEHNKIYNQDTYEIIYFGLEDDTHIYRLCSYNNVEHTIEIVPTTVLEE